MACGVLDVFHVICVPIAMGSAPSVKLWQEKKKVLKSASESLALKQYCSSTDNNKGSTWIQKQTPMSRSLGSVQPRTMSTQTAIIPIKPQRQCAQPKTVILDIDGTLVGTITVPRTMNPPRVPSGCAVVRSIVAPHTWIVFRSWAIDFVRTLASRFTVVVVTLAERNHARQVLSILDPDGTLIKGRMVTRSDTGANFKTVPTQWTTDQDCVVVDDVVGVWSSDVVIANVPPFSPRIAYSDSLLQMFDKVPATVQVNTDGCQIDSCEPIIPSFGHYYVNIDEGSCILKCVVRYIEAAAYFNDTSGMQYSFRECCRYTAQHCSFPFTVVSRLLNGSNAAVSPIPAYDRDNTVCVSRFFQIPPGCVAPLPKPVFDGGIARSCCGTSGAPTTETCKILLASNAASQSQRGASCSSVNEASSISTDQCTMTTDEECTDSFTADFDECFYSPDEAPGVNDTHQDAIVVIA